MHVLFVHQNFPAQFGHLARRLVDDHGWKATFASQKIDGALAGIECVRYRVFGGATKANHYCSRTFENATWHAAGICDALAKRPDIKPDLIVSHSGFFSTAFLRELYGSTPIVNYFEWYYHADGPETHFRPEIPSRTQDRQRARARNAVILLDLENCDRGYCPTAWQQLQFPNLFKPKLEVAFDGIDTQLWKPGNVNENGERRLGNVVIPAGTKLVTYATRGMESTRGFDIFMKLAKRIYEKRPDVQFVIAGQDRVCYGGDERQTAGKTYREHVLAQDNYDLSKFHFVGLLPPQQLAALFRMTDLHVYLTAPFILSWSLLNALACGAPILASNTPPVMEVAVEQRNALLEDFFAVDRMTDRALEVLESPAKYAHLQTNGPATVRERYSLEVCLPRLKKLFEGAAGVGGAN